MSKRSEIRIALDKFLRPGDGKANALVVRDGRRRPILIPESLVDFDKISKSGRPVLEMGRRSRVTRDGGKSGEEVWIVPAELCQISRDEPASASGVALPFAMVYHDRGLWLKHAAGYRELGVNDRGDIILSYDAEAANDPVAGPVRNAVNTVVTGGRPPRLVTRLEPGEHAADRDEAEAWLRSFAAAGPGKTLKVDFKSAGIDYTHHGNFPYLSQTIKLNFFDVRDSEMLRIASLLGLRFRKVRRKIPRVTVYSLMGLPGDQVAFAALQKKLKAARKDPSKLGLPAKLSDSRFYDPVSKGVPPSVFVLFAPLPKTPDEISVITVNVDHHGEVKSRAILSPLSAIMGLIDVISARACVAVLNKAGTATSFTGATGTGKTAAGMFWAGRNEKYRRRELRRRYETDLRRTPDAGRLGEAGIQKELDRILSRVGILCQEDWVEIFKEGAGHWVFWPTERTLYARTGGFPGLKYVLSENQPLLENVAADFGGGGDPRQLGQVNHECFPERVFYDPEWSHLPYDRSPRMISTNIFLERNGDLGFLVKRISAREAIDWLILGKKIGRAHV